MTYTLLIEGLVLSSQFVEAEQLLDELRANRNIQIKSIFLSRVLHAYIKKEKYAEAESIIEEMKMLDLLLPARTLGLIINLYGKMSQVTKAEKIYEDYLRTVKKAVKGEDLTQAGMYSTIVNMHRSI